MASRVENQIVPNEIFSRKTIKFSCTYQPLSFCKVLKEFLELIQSYQDGPFLDVKWPICPEQIFLVKAIIITFIYMLAYFFVQNLRKFLQPIQICEDAPFLDPKWSICPPPKKNFFGKLLISFLSKDQPLSLCKISKKSFQWIQSYEDVQFLGIK